MDFHIVDNYTLNVFLWHDLFIILTSEVTHVFNTLILLGSLFPEESDLKMASMKSLYDNQIHKLEEEFNAAKKENSELQAKVILKMSKPSVKRDDKFLLFKSNLA